MKTILSPNKVPDIQHTKPEVFILESLGESDEKQKRYEGLILSEMLRLSGKNPKYYYFQSKDEIPHLVGLFRQSQYRYLHLSTHANSTHIGLRQGGIKYEAFAKYFEGHLALRRLFFSACQVGNKKFVQTVAEKNKGMHSIVAPTKDIQFDHAAAIWSSLYISLFTESGKSMKHSNIEKRLKLLSGLFPVDFYYASYSSERDDWKHKTICA